MATYILLQGLDEVEDEGVAHLVDFVEEGVHHVALNLQLGEFRSIVMLLVGLRLRYEGCNAIMEHFSDSLWFGLLLGACTHCSEAILLASEIDVVHISS